MWVVCFQSQQGRVVGFLSVSVQRTFFPWKQKPLHMRHKPHKGWLMRTQQGEELHSSHSLFVGLCRKLKTAIDRSWPLPSLSGGSDQPWRHDGRDGGNVAPSDYHVSLKVKNVWTVMTMLWITLWSSSTLTSTEGTTHMLHESWTVCKFMTWMC